jgi:SAM-dependent methyltransferase
MSSDGSYQGIVAESYDIWFSGDKFDDTDFYKKLINELPGAVLEIGCGTGRLLLPYLHNFYTSSFIHAGYRQTRSDDCFREIVYASCRRRANLNTSVHSKRTVIESPKKLDCSSSWIA